MSDILENVFWIGGGSGAGKSTIAQRLAKEFGLYHHATDAMMADHGARCSKRKTPLLQAFKQMSMDERWVDRSPQTMLKTFHWYHGEGFEFIVEDLKKLSKKQRVIADGFRLLPSLVAPRLKHKRQAVWLLPTDNFRRAAFESRGTLWDIANKTSNPQRALDNLLKRDSLFTDRLRTELDARNWPTIKVDETMSEDRLADAVSNHFGLTI